MKKPQFRFLIFITILFLLFNNCQKAENSLHEKKNKEETIVEKNKNNNHSKQTTHIEKKEFGNSWEETFGGTKIDRANYASKTNDGGFIVAGATESKGKGGKDAWVIKLDDSGNIIWDETYGGLKDDEFYSIEPTPDGCFIAGGYTESKGRGSRDGWIVKISKNGRMEWDKTFGGIYWDEIHSVVPSHDSGFLAAGSFEPYGAGAQHLLLVKIDKYGKTLWEKTYGSGKWNEVLNIERQNDSYLLSGSRGERQSSVLFDTWLIKFKWLEKEKIFKRN